MSDVLTKGMKMPPKGEYSATINVHGDGKAYIDFDDVREMSAYTVLFAQCELVEVPPHGRLIDVRMLCEKSYRHYEGFMKGKIDGRTALLNIEKEIIDAPTIIPAEKEE